VSPQCAARPSHSSGHVGSTPRQRARFTTAAIRTSAQPENAHRGRLAQAHEKTLAPVPHHGERDRADSREPHHVADDEPGEERRRRHGLDLEQLAVAGDEREPEQGEERVEEAEREASAALRAIEAGSLGTPDPRAAAPGRDGIDERMAAQPAPSASATCGSGSTRTRPHRHAAATSVSPRMTPARNGDELGKMTPRDEIDQDEVDRAERHRREDPADEPGRERHTARISSIRAAG
jgi:hypothetical protein